MGYPWISMDILYLDPYFQTEIYIDRFLFPKTLSSDVGNRHHYHDAIQFCLVVWGSRRLFLVYQIYEKMVVL